MTGRLLCLVCLVAMVALAGCEVTQDFGASRSDSAGDTGALPDAGFISDAGDDGGQEVAGCDGTTACAPGQHCVKGLCLTPTQTTACDDSDPATDGCGRDAFCHEVGGRTQCYVHPACSPTRACPTGTMGAACNEGLLDEKDPVCAIGYCRSDANCPDTWRCAKGNAADTFGLCGNGSFGSPCAPEAPCTAPLNCVVMAPGAPGLCL